MSKTINALLAAQRGLIRESQGTEKQPKSKARGYVADNNESKAQSGLLVTLVLVLIFTLILAVNIKLFLTFRNTGAKFEETLTKIKNIEGAFSNGIEKFDSKLTSINSKIEQNADVISNLTETNRAQKNLISDLNRTNDALTRRLSVIEAQLGQLKSQSVAIQTNR